MDGEAKYEEVVVLSNRFDTKFRGNVVFLHSIKVVRDWVAVDVANGEGFVLFLGLG